MFDWLVVGQSVSLLGIGLDQIRAVTEEQVIKGVEDDVSGVCGGRCRKRVGSVRSLIAELGEVSGGGRVGG
ncbi:DNA-binding protein, partial [Pseudomonas syringae pv. tagetis]